MKKDSNSNRSFRQRTMCRVLAMAVSVILLSLLLQYPAAATETDMQDLLASVQDASGVTDGQTDPASEDVPALEEGDPAEEPETQEGYEDPEVSITTEEPAEPLEETAEEEPAEEEPVVEEPIEEETAEEGAEEDPAGEGQTMDDPIPELSGTELLEEVFTEDLFEELSAADPIEELPAEELEEIIPVEIPEDPFEAVPEENETEEEGDIEEAEQLVILEIELSDQETGELDIQLETEETLSIGDTGAAVRTMQSRLAALGYLNPYAVDGDYGALTQKAVKKFQMFHGLSATGTADKVTLSLIGSSTISYSGLSQGDYGYAVYGMQKILYELGYLEFAPDGDYGPRTVASVKDFQKANGLYEDGMAGPLTLEALVGSPVPYTITGEISLGAKGRAVVEIQKALISLGYLPSNADGDFGRVTQAAVITFQAACGIYNPDGSVGPVTRELLKKATKFSPIKKGKKGIDVYVMQNKLISLGYLYSVADGDFGSMTERAVKKYQMYNGLEITGIADIGTLNSLYRTDTPCSSLSLGNRGSAVLGLQKVLYALGYLELAPDGDFGQYTAQAVKVFQKANNLYADGIAGPYTIEVLLNNPVTYAVYQENIVIEYGGTYVITTALGSSVLEVASSSVYSGANVQLNAYQNYGAQKWVMQSAGNDYYYIRNLRSWKVLELAGGNVLQNECTGAASQKWKIVKAKGGGYYIINSNGMYLDPEGASAANYTNVAADAANGTKAQVWYMEEINPGTALDFKADGTQYLGIRTFSIYQGNVTETSGYYPIETDINLASGGYYLSGGDNYSIGLKVMYVNSFLAQAGYLGWDYYNYNRFDGNTVWAVRQFQYDCGIYADGVVGLDTWLAMGYSEYDWYNLGSYTTPLKVYAYGSSRDTYINAMLNTAYEYAAAGTRFADGASGVPGTYVDCSGLIFQCLYAAGINPDVSIIDHARVVYEYTSNYLGNDWQMGVAVSNAQPGDLIFYGDSAINHVAIYAGNGMIYDSWPGIGVTYRSMYSGGNILKIIRVF